jgi:sn1-specific diacylglycerol lipase
LVLPSFRWKLIYGYQWKRSAKGLYLGVKKKDKANTKILVELTGISAEDIVLAKWHSEHFHPGHYLALNHKRKALVLAIRGTFHTRDAMTDLVANYEPFMGGYAHAGMLAAAKKKFNDLMPLIVETLKKYPDYELVIVGHSLGAGTASLLSVLIYNGLAKCSFSNINRIQYKNAMLCLCVSTYVITGIGTQSKRLYNDTRSE